jgi:hypothetical protein
MRPASLCPLTVAFAAGATLIALARHGFPTGARTSHLRLYLLSLAAA